MTEVARKNLIVLRAGDRSLHPAWLGSGNRSWDLAISYYGSRKIPFGVPNEYFQNAPGSKWQGLASFFGEYSSILDRYDYVMLPDDDLLTSSEDLDKFFEEFRRSELVLGQPALKLVSYYSHPITLRNIFSRCRKTNFVEVMSPCFKTSFLRECLPTFSGNSSGWGFEWLWYDIACRLGYREAVGIIDAVSVYHTRPVGKFGSGGASEAPEFEMKRLLTTVGLTATPPKNLRFSALTKFGSRLKVYQRRLVLCLN